MKFIFAFVAVVLAAVAVEAAPGDPWQQGWSNPWQGGYQDPWRAQPSYHKGHQHYVHAIQVNQQPPIPALHPDPLHLKVHDHVNRIHYGAAHPGHPHLVGHEVHVHEPEIKIVKHGHGWA